MAHGTEQHRITKGDAQSVLRAVGSGGFAILRHSRVAEGAPADVFGSRGSIRPFQGSPWDGAHFCAEDWHCIVIADIEGGGPDFTQSDAATIMDGLTVSFTLDGTELPTTRTAISRFEDPARFDLEVAYYFQQGKVMSPDDLTVGQHDVEVSVRDPSGPVFESGITFFVDAPGTGACVGS